MLANPSKMNNEYRHYSDFSDGSESDKTETDEILLVQAIKSPTRNTTHEDIECFHRREAGMIILETQDGELLVPETVTNTFLSPAIRGVHSSVYSQETTYSNFDTELIVPETLAECIYGRLNHKSENGKNEILPVQEVRPLARNATHTDMECFQRSEADIIIPETQDVGRLVKENGNDSLLSPATCGVHSITYSQETNHSNLNNSFFVPEGFADCVDESMTSKSETTETKITPLTDIRTKEAIKSDRSNQVTKTNVKDDTQMISRTSSVECPDICLPNKKKRRVEHLSCITAELQPGLSKIDKKGHSVNSSRVKLSTSFRPIHRALENRMKQKTLFEAFGIPHKRQK